MCGESRGSSRPNAVTMLPLLQLAMAWSFATVTSAASGRACTVHMPRIGQPAVASLAPMSRRAVLTSAAALPLFAAAPLLAATVCSCPNGADSCVCVEKGLLLPLRTHSFPALSAPLFDEHGKGEAVEHRRHERGLFSAGAEDVALVLGPKGAHVLFIHAAPTPLE